MNCDTSRLALSALLDGELPAVPVGEVRDHLDRCGNCRAWQEAAHDLTRRSRLAPARPGARPSADARAGIHAAAGRERRVHEVGILRALLVATAVAQLAITIPLLIFGSIDSLRDLGAMDMALAVAFALVGWRPGRARAIAPVIGTAAGLLVLTAVLGAIRDGENVLREAPHAIAFAGWLLVCRLTRLTPPTVESPATPWWQTARTVASRIARRQDTKVPERPPGRSRMGAEGGHEPAPTLPPAAAVEREGRRAVA